MPRIPDTGVGVSLFTREDIPEFLALAGAEGWISGAWEIEFLLRVFPSGCLVCRRQGTPVAFVTSVKYERSGWIGNLIVRQDMRGMGLGYSLFRGALQALLKAGAQTVWLAASGPGRPLYDRLGFLALDTIVRWEGRCCPGSDLPPSGPEDICALDSLGWGDRRSSLLEEVRKRGTLSALLGGFLVCQRWDGALQLGPWAAADLKIAAALLGRAVVPAEDGFLTFLDVPEGNGAVSYLLRSHGFLPTSSTTLMYLGDAPAYVPGRIYALASMGSMG